MNRHRPVVSSVAGPGTPGIVVVDDHDHRQAILGQSIHLHRSVAEAGVSGYANDRMALVGRLNADAVLHRSGDPNRVANIGSNRSVLVGSVHYLPRSVSAEKSSGVTCNTVAAGDHGCLLLWYVAAIEKIAQLPGDHRRMDRVLITDSEFVIRITFVFELFAGGGDLCQPGIALHRRHLAG